MITLNQPKYRDYGLPSARELPDSAFAQAPKLLSKAESGDLAHTQIVKAVLGEENNYRIISTPREAVVVSKKLLKHISERRLALGERYANFILPTLMEPNEIWLTIYKDGSFRRRFIKLFKGKKSMLVIAQESTDGSLFCNAMPAQSSVSRQSKNWSFALCE